MSILSPALLGAVGLVLLASAAAHLRSPAALRRGLDAHGVLPPGARGPVALVLGPLEALLGAGALVTAVIDVPSGVALAVSMPIAGLFLAFTLYLGQVLRAAQGRVVPCACGLGEAPVSRTAVLRGGILTTLALVGGVSADGWSLAGAPAAEAGVALAAMLVIALSVALLPAARAVPEAAIRREAGIHHELGGQNLPKNARRASKTSPKMGGEHR
ncbi:hypothetical protein MWU75_15285 [Ornithinimicrobium sp. F0845]|uniref:MauE/DoxX family redox-associated membrane protein n=1 Tax=Ornithinimicrobium sp. F0845 TaxID=2926412 RepID=UPI001FF31F2D|nr:MauE/DoxX family redox-associated membrane protein [Ornithinimicrobium sp. F0845]MCK0113510.1 hypothetical protein [Ornithinimicrobium sp. F0845]